MRCLMPVVAGVAVAVFAWMLSDSSSRAAPVPLSIAIQGNHFVNGAGQAIRLVGANHPSAEYACVDGFGYNDGHQADADAATVASWHANAIRIPLNEDCWLGINGQPNSSQGPPQPLTQAGYQKAVENYVSALNAHGVYAILDLHWTASGNAVANSQEPMPDAHSTAFWQSVAQTFKSNPAVVFDVFNEPFDPTDPKSGDDPDPTDKVSWDCWQNGGCSTAAYTNNGSDTVRTGAKYPVVGLQTLVNTIRAAGATQPVMTGGLDYANDLSQWADHAPDDPLNQEAASFHNYQGKSCDNAACWNTTIAAVATAVPVVTGEFDQDVCRPSTFDNDYMTWADQHGVGYLAWGWWVLSRQEIADAGCSAYYLLSDWKGTPAAPNGTNLHDHLAALAGVRVQTAGSLTHFSATLAGMKLRFSLRSPVACTATLAIQTVNLYVVRSGHRTRRTHVSLGGGHFALPAGRTRTISVPLSSAGRHLLLAHRTVKVQVTITLKSASGTQTERHVVTLSRR